MYAGKMNHDAPFRLRHIPKRLRRFVPTSMLVLAVLHGWIGAQLLPEMHGVTFWVGVVWLAFSWLCIPLGMFARILFRQQDTMATASWLGMTVLGLFSWLLVLTVVRFVLLLLPNMGGWIAFSAQMVPALAVLLTLSGFFQARRIPRVNEVDIYLPDLPQELEGFSLVQLSDVHIGPTIRRGFVQAVVTRVNALQADMVAITGDVVDGKVDHLAHDVAPLGTLQSRHGTFLVTGNHEYYAGVDDWVRLFRQMGMQVLMNAHAVVNHLGARLVVAGVTDYSAGKFDPQQASNPHVALAGSPDGVVRILLAHQPRSVKAALAAGADIQLSGHTHGGQFWPWNFLVPLQQPFTAGLHRYHGLWLYVSRGTGYWGPPMRFGAPSEITLLRLWPKAARHRIRRAKNA